MSAKTYIEPQTTIPVYDECDVLVVGGGSAGHSAAVAAARAGCKNIILMERYGYCGGDVTGGYVLLIPNLSFHEKTYVRGIQEEWFTRLKKIPGAVAGPDPELAGSQVRLHCRPDPAEDRDGHHARRAEEFHPRDVSQLGLPAHNGEQHLQGRDL